ncbi:hypothetical protein AVEN_29951-1 [Araneus ventricosus]|uniref:Uncharacterized protein n=1 Tax=Araneus ventricosus TaxID=182803 RepID=A0A4Y2WG12_ARAVE|nr:hypothetical protein AVEN_29951-1 [Araneus ventricosus]
MVRLYILKKFLQWYFLQKIRHNEENLLELKKRKKSLLEFAMETETYKVVKELLEKYDPAYHRKVLEPKPAIEAPPTPPLKGSFGEMGIYVFFIVIEYGCQSQIVPSIFHCRSWNPVLCFSCTPHCCFQVVTFQKASKKGQILLVSQKG